MIGRQLSYRADINATVKLRQAKKFFTRDRYIPASYWKLNPIYTIVAFLIMVRISITGDKHEVAVISTDSGAWPAGFTGQ